MGSALGRWVAVDSPRLTARRLTATGVAAAVYLGTLVVLGAGVVLIVVLGGPLAIVLGIVLILITLLLGPRPSRLDRAVTVVEPDSAPTLHAITGRIADELGIRHPARIAVDGTFSVELGRVGLLGRRVVIIGLPLWTVLEPAERVAALARCLADDASGELRRNAVMEAAVGSMYQLFRTLNEPARGAALGGKYGDDDPKTPYRSSTARAALLDRTGRGLMRLFAIPVRWLIRWQESLLTADSARACRFADRRCAELVGADLTVRVLDKTVLREAAMNQLRASVLRGEQDPLAWVGTWYEGLSTDERAAIAARAEPDDEPRESRMALLASMPGTGSCTVELADWVRVDGELAPVLAPVHKDIHDWAVSARN